MCILFTRQLTLVLSLTLTHTTVRAVVDPASGEIVARPMMYLALTYDHRLIDGREGVTFLKSIAEKISDPSKLLLEI